MPGSKNRLVKLHSRVEHHTDELHLQKYCRSNAIPCGSVLDYSMYCNMVLHHYIDISVSAIHLYVVLCLNESLGSISLSYSVEAYL